MNLQQIKKEVREELLKRVNLDGYISYAKTRDFLEETIDRVVEIVEREVVPDCIDSNCDRKGTIAERDGEGEWQPAPCQYCYQVRFPLQEAFTKLRSSDVTEKV